MKEIVRCTFAFFLISQVAIAFTTILGNTKIHKYTRINVPNDFQTIAQRISDISLIECAATCSARTDCKAFNLNNETNNCRIFNLIDDLDKSSENKNCLEEMHVEESAMKFINGESYGDGESDIYFSGGFHKGNKMNKIVSFKFRKTWIIHRSD